MLTLKDIQEDPVFLTLIDNSSAYLGSFAATFVAQARKGLVERHNRTYFFAF
jgi:hypothetical protein